MALDERRAAFPPTPWSNVDVREQESGNEGLYEQLWFCGVHGDIGGQTSSDLSSFPLEWIIEGADRRGLAFARDRAPLATALSPSRMDPGAMITRTSFWSGLSPLNWKGQWRTTRDASSPIDVRHARRIYHYSVAARLARQWPMYRTPSIAADVEALAAMAEFAIPRKAPWWRSMFGVNGEGGRRGSASTRR